MFDFAAPVWLARQPDETHRAAWRWLAERVRPYPAGSYVPPMRARPSRRQPKPFVVAELATDDDGQTRNPTPTGLRVFDGELELGAQLTGQGTDVPAIERLLFARRFRGYYVAFWHGGRFAFHVILRRYAHALAVRGYRIRPFPDGGELKAIVVTKGKHTWTLTDCQAMSGLYECNRAQFQSSFLGPAAADTPGLWPLYESVRRLQRLLIELFGTALSPTLGMCAVRAASQFIEEDAWLWRPPPGLVALCRSGGGYRGGYVYGEPYRGPAHKLDMTRLYTWALTQPLPLKAGVGHCLKDDDERPGMYVCDLRGPGAMPVYVSVWRGPSEGFRRQLWNGEHAVTVLPQAEFAGLRALGYDVTPGFGYVWFRTFDLRCFAERLAGLMREHRLGSAQNLLAKKLGNSLYGKLAEPAQRVEVVYALHAPGQQWHPFMTDEGEEVAGLWTRKVVRHRSHQHIDIAAEITALGRARLYDGFARIVQAGERVIAADTDGLLTPSVPAGFLDGDPDELGGWRSDGYDPLVSVVGPRLYVHAGKVRAAGVENADAAVVEVAYDRGSVVVGTKRLAPPWQDGAMYRDVRVRLSRARPPAASAREGSGRRGRRRPARRSRRP